MTAIVGASGAHRFRVREQWWTGGRPSADVSHHGIAVTGSGEVITQHPDRSGLVVLDRSGTRQRSWPLTATQAHGLTVATEDTREVVWIADNGAARVRDTDGSYRKAAPRRPVQGAVTKHTLAGTELLRLPAPPLDSYRDGDYSPTQVAVAGSGDLWVADGHGQHLVHRYDRCGDYRSTIDGSNGAGRFDHPHGLLIDGRGDQERLLVADRNHGRIQVFDLEGRFIRAFGEEFLVSPSSMVPWGDVTIVAEHRGRLAIVDGDDRFVGYLAELDDAGPDATTCPPARGIFGAPHALAVDQAMNLYLTEYVIGGRHIKLEYLDRPGNQASG